MISHVSDGPVTCRPSSLIFQTPVSLSARGDRLPSLFTLFLNTGVQGKEKQLCLADLLTSTQVSEGGYLLRVGLLWMGAHIAKRVYRGYV